MSRAFEFATGLFGASRLLGGSTLSQSETRIEALQFQSSAYGVVIPLVYGLTRISGNLLWYGGFKAIPHTTSQGGKGGGVKVQNTTFTYAASVAMGLCHGSIAGLPRIWRGKKLYSGDVTPGQVTNATETYVVPGSGAMSYTTAHAAAWLGLLDVYIPAYTWPTPQDLVSGGGSGTYDKRTLAAGTEYTLAAGVLTILSDALRGETVTIEYQYTSSAITHTALQQLGLSFQPGHIAQAAWTGFANAGAPTAQQLGYSGLSFVGGLDYDLGTGAQVENHLLEVVAPMAYHLGSSVPDVDPALMLRDLLTNARAGAAFPASGLDGWADWSDACVANNLLVSPALTAQVRAAEVVAMAARLTNCGPVWSDGKLKMIPFADAAASANGRTYTPNTTPVYDLDDECWLEPPTVEIKSPADRYNHVRVEYLDRANQYNVAIAEAKDQADIDANGLRSMDVVQAHWICDTAVARQVAQILLQRSLYVTATYTAPFPWHFALIEPMDLNTLTDTGLGLALLPARVVAIEEAEDGELTITHEDYPAGVCSAAVYQSQVPAGYAHDYNVAPGAVLAPVIFELPAHLAASGLEIGVAVAGAGANWGGCQVWVSTDGTNYKQIGTLYGPSRYGKLTGAISGGNLPVLLNAGQLTSGSAADAAALNTLCYIGGAAPEFCAFQTATLTGALAYTLSGLVRGAYGSSAAGAHATNDPFVRVDEGIARSGALDLGRVGGTVYVKCPSFNIYGAAQESLAAATAYTYTIVGWRFGIPPTDWEDIVGQSVDPGSFFEGFLGTTPLNWWTNLGGSGELSVVSVSDAGSGGMILRVGNNSGNDMAWLTHTRSLAFDPSALYRIKARVRRTAGTGLCYVGLLGYAADGTTLVNSTGAASLSSQHCVAAAAEAPGSSWTEYTGYVRGTAATGTTTERPDPSAPGVMHQDVRYIRPLLVANYNAAAGTTEVDYISVERLGGQIGTGDLGDEAATAVSQASVASHVNGVTGGSGGSIYENAATLENTWPFPVYVEIDATLGVTVQTVAGVTITISACYLEADVYVSGGSFVASYGDANPEAPIPVVGASSTSRFSMSKTILVPLEVGQEVRTRVKIAYTSTGVASGSTITTRDAVTRFAVIKR